MKFPSLVRNCKTDIHVVLYKEEITENGEQIIAIDKNLKCNYQDKARRVFDEQKVLIQLTGKAYFNGDIAPELSVITSGYVEVFGEKRQIYQGTKARNLDGTVNYTELELK